MALLMGAAMALVMLAFMRSMMYKNRTLNRVVVSAAVVLAAAVLYLSRSQVLVDDQAHMNGMIPHHSIAILTSERADIDDFRVRELADAIIEAQRREIREMDWLVGDIEKNGLATTQAEARERPVPDFKGQAAGGDASTSRVFVAVRHPVGPLQRASRWAFGGRDYSVIWSTQRVRETRTCSSLTRPRDFSSTCVSGLV